MITQAEAFSFLERLLGFRLEPTRAPDVTRVLGERLRARGCVDAKTYALLLDDPAVRSAETRIVADRLTVNETYFLRESAHLRIVVDRLVPRVLARGEGPVRVLSVGCSTGEEPYGLALLLHEAGVGRDDVEILGLDVSSNVVESARRARYTEWSLRNVPADVRSRYFVRDRKGYALVDELKHQVRFDVVNVADGDSSFWEKARFDVVFCRNLLIYLTPEAIERAMARFAQVLEPGGALFLGHAETALASARFVVQEGDGAFYFRLREAGEAGIGRTRRGSARVSEPTRGAEARSDDRAWIESIRRSGNRLRALTDSATTTTVAAPSSSRPEELDEVFELIRLERFAEALTRLEDREIDGRTERGLLRALVLTNLGRTVDAARAAEARLALVPACPFAHYLLGLCREQLLQFDEARFHYARAVDADPDFAMPRLRAGMLARRAGQPEEAKKSLESALDRFRKQGARTSLLYGGGFAPEALASLCRAELSALESRQGGAGS